jgi:hypothetical protein
MSDFLTVASAIVLNDQVPATSRTQATNLMDTTAGNRGTVTSMVPALPWTGSSEQTDALRAVMPQQQRFDQFSAGVIFSCWHSLCGKRGP